MPLTIPVTNTTIPIASVPPPMPAIVLYTFSFIKILHPLDSFHTTDFFIFQSILRHIPHSMHQLRILMYHQLQLFHYILCCKDIPLLLPLLRLQQYQIHKVFDFIKSAFFSPFRFYTVKETIRPTIVTSAAPLTFGTVSSMDFHVVTSSIIITRSPSFNCIFQEFSLSAPVVFFLLSIRTVTYFFFHIIHQRNCSLQLQANSLVCLAQIIRQSHLHTYHEWLLHNIHLTFLTVNRLHRHCIS